MLFMVEKGIKSGMCHEIHKYAKVKDFIKTYDVMWIVIKGIFLN